MRRQLAQLVIDQRQQGPCRRGLSLLGLLEQDREFAHGPTLPLLPGITYKFCNLNVARIRLAPLIAPGMLLIRDVCGPARTASSPADLSCGNKPAGRPFDAPGCRPPPAKKDAWKYWPGSPPPPQQSRSPCAARRTRPAIFSGASARPANGSAG